MTNKKRKKARRKYPATFLHIIERTAFLRAELPTNLTNVLQLSIFMNKLLILMFEILVYLFKKTTSIRKKTGESFSPMPRKWKLSLVSLLVFIVTVNQLPSIPMFWDCNYLVGNVVIQNISAWTRYQVVLQNNHFADNTKQDKTDKGNKIRIIDHLNK